MRELKRQMKSMLFHRLALSKDKAGVLKIAEKGIEMQEPEDSSIVRQICLLQAALLFQMSLERPVAA